MRDHCSVGFLLAVIVYRSIVQKIRRYVGTNSKDAVLFPTQLACVRLL